MTNRAAALRVAPWLVLGAVLAALGLPGCGVTTPTPTPPPRPPGTRIVVGTSSAPLQRVEIYYTGGRDWLGIGSTFGFGLFGVHSDGVYERLTLAPQISWQSSNPAVIELQNPSFGTLRAVSPGTAVITATYQGLSDSVTQEIRSGQPPFPYLNIQPYAAPSEELRTERARALWHESPSFVDVTTQAAWTSSNTLVATANAGLITAVGVGTTRITATYQGVSKSYVFSVSTSVSR